MTRAKDISKIVTDADLSGTLEVTKGASGASANAAADELVLQNSGDAGLSILSPNANNSQILLGSPVANAGGIIRWTGDDNAVKIGTNNTGSTLRFHVGGFSEVIRISSAGLVGISTSNPLSQLTIGGNANTTAKPTVAITDTTNGATMSMRGQSPKIAFDVTSSGVPKILMDNAGLEFKTGTLDAEGDVDVKIDSSGNVGIGGSPTAKLDVTGAIEADDKITIAYEAGSSDWELESTSGDDFTISRNGSQKLLIDGSTSNVGIGTSSPATTLDVYGNINLRSGYNLTWGGSYGANIPTIAAPSGAGANIQFFPAGNTSGETMRIHSTGATSFGTSDASPYIATEGHVVALNDGSRYGGLFGCDNIANRDAIAFVNPNGFVGSIKTNGSSTSYNTSSDHRLKESVTYDFDATTRLKQLKPCRFNFIADADTTVDGFLAHEVQSVVPEAISGTHNEVDDNGNPVYQQIDQSKLVPLLVKTIQELEARIVALETA